MHEPVLFSTAIEATFLRGLGPRVGPELKARLKAAGIDLDRLLPAYPVPVYANCIALTVEALMPGKPLAEAHRELGALSFRGFANTFMGRAIVAVTRILGPERTLPRMTHNMKSGVNFMEFSTTKRAPGSFELICTDTGGLPHFYAGLIQEGLGDTGAKDVVVTIEAIEGSRVVYAVTWRP